MDRCSASPESRGRGTAAKYKTKARTNPKLSQLCSGAVTALAQTYGISAVEGYIPAGAAVPVGCAVPGHQRVCVPLCVWQRALTDLCSLLKHTALYSWHLYDGLLNTEPAAPLSSAPPAHPSPSLLESLPLPLAFCDLRPCTGWSSLEATFDANSQENSRDGAKEAPLHLCPGAALSLCFPVRTLPCAASRFSSWEILAES